MRPLLALFLRSLREDIRSRFTYVVRSMLVALGLFSMLVLSSTWQWMGAGGRELLGTMLNVDLFILCVVGISYFASAITEEKEDGTLGLLRMTELSAFAILIGKGGPRILNALFLVVAQLPFALAAVTFGGLHVRQVFAGCVLLLSFAFLAANIGLLASTLCRRSAGASLLTALLLAVFSFAPGVFSSSTGSLFTLWRELAPLAWRDDLLATSIATSIVSWRCAVYFLLGVLAFIGAWLVFDRCSDAALEATAQKADRELASTLALRRAPVNPIHWKDFHYVSGGRWAMVIKGLLVAILVAFVFNFASQPWRKSEFYCLGLSLALPSALLLGICFSIDASRIFKTERRDRTLSSLLGLPLAETTIAWWKVFGCLRTSFVPILCLGLGFAVLPCAIGWELWGKSIRPNEACDLVCWILYVFAAMLSLPVLIAWLSLHVRWGAFPIGLALWAVGNWIVWLTLQILVDSAALAIIPFANASLVVFLVLEIGARLERLAGE